MREREIEREERNRDQELGPRVDDQGWIDPWPSYRVLQLTRCQLSFSLLLSYSSVLGSLPRSLLEYIFCLGPRVISAGHSSTHFITTGTTTAMTTIPSLQRFPVALK